jgi:serine protease Do
MRNFWLCTACLLLGAALGTLGSSLLQGQGPAAPPLPKEATSYREVVKKVLPAVVSIDARGKGAAAPPALRAGEKHLPEELRGVFEEPRFEGPSADEGRVGFGSGFVISPRGVLVTNNHVVQGADEAIVTFSDGTKLTTRKIFTDPKTDLAILTVEARGELACLDWGDSEAMEIGDRVLAVGAPFGLTGSVTHGIISAVGRSLRLNMYEDFLQTDAAINPGNSGGPLVSLDGKVVGITSAIRSRSGGFQGVGLAISSNLGKEVVAALLRDGRVRRGYLGIGVRDVDAERARVLGLPEVAGIEVTEVHKGGPGEKAGLRTGDVLTHLAGKPVRDGKELQAAAARLPLGKPAIFGLIRGGKRAEAEVTVEEQPASYGTFPGRLPDVGRDGIEVEGAGLALHDLTPELATALKYDARARGALILRMKRNGPAARAGLEPGHLITAVAGKPVVNARQAAAALASASLAAGARVTYRTPSRIERTVILRAE